jgi:hypothetical protein
MQILNSFHLTKNKTGFAKCVASKIKPPQAAVLFACAASLALGTGKCYLSLSAEET